MIWNRDYQTKPGESTDRFPNGYTRQEYYDVGFSDLDIENWGQDQPGAPDPQVAMMVIVDMLAEDDWDGDGEPVL